MRLITEAKLLSRILVGLTILWIGYRPASAGIVWTSDVGSPPYISVAAGDTDTTIGGDGAVNQDDGFKVFTDKDTKLIFSDSNLDGKGQLFIDATRTFSSTDIREKLSNGLAVTGSFTSDKTVTVSLNISTWISPEHPYEVTYTKVINGRSGKFELPLKWGPDFAQAGLDHTLVLSGGISVSGSNASGSWSVTLDFPDPFVATARAIPEPSTLVLTAMGTLTLLGARRRRPIEISPQ